MPTFSEENQKWIHNEIRESIHPNGFRKVADRLRYWGLLGVCITVVVALIATLVTLIVFTTNKVSQEAEFRISTPAAKEYRGAILIEIGHTLTLSRAQTVAQKYSKVPQKELKIHNEELKQIKTTLADLYPRLHHNIGPPPFRSSR